MTGQRGLTREATMPNPDLTLTRVKTDEPIPCYQLSSEYGSLTYNPVYAELSSDGGLVPWSVAHAYAIDCRDVLYERGEDALWQYMESRYRRMIPHLADAVTRPNPMAVEQ